ncbi:hypothetical protein PR202_ga04587 [Eleusine coracana subsp. coracana]|uniref:Uncharacterized protein n=1 Tax=Eleusine coracana subsp. coracana TaxID=191504 RepID=A0AAV5BQ98_ELECO|nr:hypothetical protein PR202_ga04587 [Eleusine coracana subsp. coracana]
MEQQHGINSFGEFDTQPAHIAVSMTDTLPLGSRSGMARRFGKEEAEHAGETAEQLDGEDYQGGSTPQCAADHDLGMTTMAFDHGYSGAAGTSTQQDPPDDFITEMVEEMRDAGATIEFKEQVPMLEQEVEDVVLPLPMAGESNTTEHLFAYPRFCGASGVGDTAAGMLGGFAWGDFCLC